MSGSPEYSEMGMVAYVDYLPDNYDEVVAEFPVLATSCAQCPATPGTAASQNPVTASTLAECIRARCGFFCHMTRDGEFCTHLCAGWAAAVAPDAVNGD
jgi:hypothetical protein